MSSGRLLVLALTVLIPLCAILAAFGFRGRAKVVGIDLGTTFSVVAIRDGADYEVRVIEDDDGRQLVPSIVAFLGGSQEPRRTLVGHDAAALRFEKPEQVIFNAKRFIGKAWGDAALKEVMASHPFKVVEKSANVSEAWFDVGAAGDEWVVSPEEVGESVVRHLLEMVARDLGHSQVNQAVIAVPADFDARQRRATGEAFKRAGLKVVRVLEEPTAAALAYDLHRKEDVNHILVYDFGGGTLDVSILFVNEGSVQVIGSAGDGRLGGSDFDMCLGRRVQDVLADKEAVKTSKCPAKAAEDLLPCGEETLNRALAEQAKIALTKASDAVVSCRATTKRGACEMRTFTLTRADFNEACADEFRRSRVPIEEALEAVDLRPQDIDEVVMVGGSSRIPAVRDLVKDALQKDRLNVDIDPDLTVAIGAASVVD